MNKFNRKFNNSCARLNFWDTLTRHLAAFESFLKAQDILTNEDKITLKKIHALLYHGYQEARARRKFHFNRITALKPENK